MNYKIINTLGLVCALTILASACSNSETTYRGGSPWEQRRSQEEITAPAADVYTRELAAVDAGSSNVELNYQTEQVDTFVPAAVDETPAEPVEAAAVSVEDEILGQPADYYTVQLMASVDVDRVYKFAEQHQLSVRYIVPTFRDGVTWHVLLLDVYPTLSEAKAALQEVSYTLPTKPWVRSLGSVQKLMR
ncbi:MAG: hypothetical protein EP315_03570 [Gammaproteobacteria bacterium]|nr:MAG: hypothetical protein EP315_03570 [Gammaproteobacteria bacterium]